LVLDVLKELKLLNLSNTFFINEIETLCQSKNIEYIDAVVYWCEKNNVEIEYVASFIKKDPVFKSKIEAEAENLNILKKTARLPI
jgi:hypothetical protein